MQDNEKHKKDRKKRDDRDKRERIDVNRDRREEGKERKESEKEKREETRDRRSGAKIKKENTGDKRNNMLGMEAENKERREKDKDRGKEKELMKCSSWAELRKLGLSIDDIIHLRRRDNTQRPLKNRYNAFLMYYFQNRIRDSTCHRVDAFQSSARLLALFGADVNVEQLPSKALRVGS